MPIMPFASSMARSLNSIALAARSRHNIPRHPWKEKNRHEKLNVLQLPLALAAARRTAHHPGSFLRGRWRDGRGCPATGRLYAANLAHHERTPEQRRGYLSHHGTRPAERRRPPVSESPVRPAYLPLVSLPCPPRPRTHLPRHLPP